MRSRAVGARALTVGEQAARVRMLWPSLVCRVNGDTVVITGVVQPTPLSESYRVRIVYGHGSTPAAYVESPALRARDDGTPIPHVYPGPRPCLYLPGSGEWTNRKAVATTIIPWLLLWLTYYELWHATGEWQGGGVEHPAPNANVSDDGPKDEPPPAPMERADEPTL